MYATNPSHPQPAARCNTTYHTALILICIHKCLYKYSHLRRRHERGRAGRGSLSPAGSPTPNPGSFRNGLSLKSLSPAVWLRILQGYLADKKPPLLGPPQGPRHRPTVGSLDAVVSYNRGTPVPPPIHSEIRWTTPHALWRPSLLKPKHPHPEPHTLNPTPSTPHPQPHTLNPTPSTQHLNPNPSTQHPQPNTRQRTSHARLRRSALIC